MPQSRFRRGQSNAGLAVCQRPAVTDGRLPNGRAPDQPFSSLYCMIIDHLIHICNFWGSCLSFGNWLWFSWGDFPLCSLRRVLQKSRLHILTRYHFSSTHQVLWIFYNFPSWIFLLEMIECALLNVARHDSWDGITLWLSELLYVGWPSKISQVHQKNSKVHENSFQGAPTLFQGAPKRKNFKRW